MHIPSGYINATTLVSYFNTKNNTRKEFFNWKQRNTARIAALETYVKTYAEDELMEYDDGTQKIMFSISNHSDLFDMDYTGKVTLTKDTDTSLEDTTKTFYAIKGTYVHPILISYLLVYLDISLEGIHATIVFNNYKEQSFKKAVLNNKLTSNQAIECREKLTNEIDTCKAIINDCSIEQVRQDNDDFKDKYYALEQENKKLTNENKLLIDKVDEVLAELRESREDNKKTHAKLDNIISSVTNITTSLNDIAIKIATNAALDPNKKEGVLIGFNVNNESDVFQIRCGQQEYLDPIIKRYKNNNIEYMLFYNIANSKSTLNQLVKELKLKRIYNTCTFKNINNISKLACDILNIINIHYQYSIGKVTNQVTKQIK